MKELTLIEKMVLIVYFAGKRLARLGNKILDILSDIVYVHDCFICKLFKPYGRKVIFGILCGIAVVLFIATVGGSDTNSIEWNDIVKYCTTSLVLMVYSFHNARI